MTDKPSSTAAIMAIAGAGAYASLRALAAIQPRMPVDELLNQLQDIFNYFKQSGIRHDDVHKIKRLNHFLRLIETTNQNDFLTVQKQAPYIPLFGEYYNLVQVLKFEQIAQYKNNPQINAVINLLREQAQSVENKIHIRNVKENASGINRIKLDISEMIREVNKYFDNRLTAIERDWNDNNQISVTRSSADLANIRERLLHWSKLSQVSDLSSFQEWRRITPQGAVSVRYATLLARLRWFEWISVRDDEEIKIIHQVSVENSEMRYNKYEEELTQAREILRAFSVKSTAQERGAVVSFAWSSVTDVVRYPLNRDVAMQNLSMERKDGVFSRTNSLSK